MKTISSICVTLLYLCLPVLWSGNLCYSQGIYNNGATIVIPTGAAIYIDGDANGGIRSETNVSDGVIDLDGDLYIEGNWTNNDAAGDGLTNVDADGTVHLNGAAQNIGGTRATRFENLIIEGSSIKTITESDATNDTRVNGTLTLNDTLNLNSHTIIIQSGTPSSITRTSGYIISEGENSLIQWNTNGVLADSVFVFPFGDNGTYIPFTFNKMDTATATNISVSTWNTSIDNMTNLPSGTSMNVDTGSNFFVDRWWSITPVPVITSKVTFEFLASEVTGGVSLADPVTYHWNSWLGWWEEIPAVSTGNNVTSIWSEYSGGGGGGSGAGPLGPLPIELLYFEAIYNINTEDVDLTWITATEINNDFFTVERSVDAIDFEKVVTVPGAGNSNQILNYAAVDEDPYYGISYYRLKQTDYDGKYEYSNIVAVMIIKTSDLIIYPNPATENLTFLFNDVTDADVLIEIFDVQGKLVYLKRHKTTKGANYINISLSSFSQGMYFVKLIAENSLFKAKFVKEE